MWGGDEDGCISWSVFLEIAIEIRQLPLRKQLAVVIFSYLSPYTTEKLLYHQNGRRLRHPGSAHSRPGRYQERRGSR